MFYDKKLENQWKESVKVAFAFVFTKYVLVIHYFLASSIDSFAALL